MRCIIPLALLIALLINTVALAQDDTEQETIIVPISLYILTSEEDGPSDYASQQDIADLETLLDGMNELWGQANIQFEANYIGPLALPEDMLFVISKGAYRDFFEQVAYSLDLQEPGVLNAFFAREVGGPNGVVPFGSRVFFMMDEPTRPARRVASHEAGHILGLHHELADETLLMFPGGEGVTLTDEEITVARYITRGILIGIR